MVNKMLETLQVPLLLSSSEIPNNQMNSILSKDNHLGRINYKPLNTRPTAGCRLCVIIIIRLLLLL